MSAPLWIVGAGGFGREVWALLEARRAAGDDRYRVAGFVDDAPRPETCRRLQQIGQTVVGPIADLAARREPYDAVIALGDPALRRRVHGTLSASPARFPVLVHPDATIGTPVDLAEGCVVAAGARLSTNIVLGRHVHIDQNATVGHDTVLSEFVRLNPQACVSGSVQVGAAALIGAGAVVLQGLRVGAGATVGAAACVVRDVAPGSVVKGVPAR